MSFVTIAKVIVVLGVFVGSGLLIWLFPYLREPSRADSETTDVAITLIPPRK